MTVGAENVLPEVVVVGSGRARGRAHGEQRRSAAREHLERWEDQLRRATGLRTEEYLDRVFTQTSFEATIQRLTPDLWEEVVGISEGAGTDFRRTLARQLSDEEPWLRRELAAADAESCRCSAIGYEHGGAAVLSQNMDVPGWWLGHQQLLRARRGDLECLVLTVAGKISLAGMNSRGLGICCNTLSALEHSPSGLPEDFVVRGFLACSSWEQGWRFLHEVPHASGQNYMIGGPDGQLACLECSARSVVVDSTMAGPYLIHTNTVWSNPDLVAGHEVAGTDTSVARAAALERALSGETKPSLAALRRVLASGDGPICRTLAESNGRSVTLGSLVMHLSERRLEVSSGPPDRNPYLTYQLD